MLVHSPVTKADHILLFITLTSLNAVPSRIVANFLAACSHELQGSLCKSKSGC